MPAVTSSVPTKRTRTISMAMVLAAASHACNGHKKSEEPAKAPAVAADAVPIVSPAPSPPSPLAGDWRANECTPRGTDLWTKELLVFQGSVVIAARTYYSDAKCEAMNHTMTLQGSFVSGAANARGGTNLDLLYNQWTATYPDRLAAGKALNDDVSGPNAVCAPGRVPAVSGSIIDLTPCAQDAAALYQYTVYTVKDSELHLALPGSDAAVTGKAPSTRALNLDAAAVYIK